jgi:RNA-splicing ligase RtcB
VANGQECRRASALRTARILGGDHGVARRGISRIRGPGRRYSRMKARALFGMGDRSRAMAGIEYRHSKVLLDEIPAAYKDIDEVMDHARDLVEVKYVLKQFVNAKGD